MRSKACKNTAKRSISMLMVALLMLLCIASCRKEKSQTVSYEKDSEEIIISTEKNNSLHITDFLNLEYVSKSGLLEMYFDPTSYGVTIRETSKNKMWYVLPEILEENDGTSLPSVVEVKMEKDNKILYLNSQDNCVAYGTATYKKTDSGVSISYIMAQSAESAVKAKETGTYDAAVKLTVNYRLENGSFYSEIDCAGIEYDTSYKITEMSFLKYFGSFKKAQSGDYILVPDGSGAIIRPYVSDETFKPVEIDVYGSNSAVEDSYQAGATAALFGIKSGDSAFAAIIQEGSAISKICADRSEGASGYNYVGSEFNITDSKLNEAENTVTKNYAKNTYSGKISICYRFLSDENADYAGMAAVCREQLIRDTMLSNKTLTESENLPFNLSVIGAAKPTYSGIGILKKLTTFEQAQDLLTLMKSRGIENININYKGVFSGGIESKNIINANILNRLGSNKDFEELAEYIESQNFSLNFDVNLLSAKDSFSAFGKNSGNSVDFENITAEEINLKYPLFGKEIFNYRLRSLNSVEKAVVSLLNKTKKLQVSGFTLNDAGKFLYSDYTNDYIDRESAQNLISENILSLTTNNKLTVSNGNIYSLKEADLLIDMPCTLTQNEETEAYESVPFMQIVLHGTLDYSMIPVNMSPDSKMAILKAIEYGACPYFEWIYEKETSEKVSLYYEDWMSTASDYYKKANEMLNDLRTSTITDHDKIDSGVYRTIYNNGVVIYVNYTEKDVLLNGVLIKAKDAIRVN